MAVVRHIPCMVGFFLRLGVPPSLYSVSVLYFLVWSPAVCGRRKKLEISGGGGGGVVLRRNVLNDRFLCLTRLTTRPWVIPTVEKQPASIQLSSTVATN